MIIIYSTKIVNSSWPLMSWINFLTGKLDANSPEYFGAFATTMTSQYNTYQFKVLPCGCNLNGEVQDPQFWGLWDWEC